MYTANTLLKRARDVQKALEPKSEIHAAQDIAKLRQQITCLEELFRELPMGTVGGIADDLQLAIKVGEYSTLCKYLINLFY
jgi:hypothetical protein